MIILSRWRISDETSLHPSKTYLIAVTFHKTLILYEKSAATRVKIDLEVVIYDSGDLEDFLALKCIYIWIFIYFRFRAFRQDILFIFRIHFCLVSYFSASSEEFAIWKGVFVSLSGLSFSLFEWCLFSDNISSIQCFLVILTYTHFNILSKEGERKAEEGTWKT